ncbi:PREDICTED: chymotrypsin inhibitor SCI-II-like [Rhagoletis zephyria]|uniref:chymotrypsin inhibitor SCI-II-like n=1 Tax=Rhagoletis zephyria TaxID=28612 RepID=UPI00081122FB|nr:PREDICTED: chymotrypsin inhibitor SCI-II-like [Rhagoletis zephyria]
MQFSREVSIVFVLLLCSLLCADALNRRVKVCLQSPQSGRCFGYVPSFAYNPIARKCEEFIYGGCGGNDNRFDTKKECELSCRDV